MSVCIKDSCVVLVEGADGLSLDYSFYRQGGLQRDRREGCPLERLSGEGCLQSETRQGTQWNSGDWGQGGRGAQPSTGTQEGQGSRSGNRESEAVSCLGSPRGQSKQAGPRNGRQGARVCFSMSAGKTEQWED